MNERCKYKFILTHNSTPREVFPLGFLECALIDEVEENNIFYRSSFDGELTFGGKGLQDDFNYLWNIENSTPCDRIDITIYRNENIYWQGYFSTSSGEWDLDECTFKVTPLVLDNYNVLLDKSDIEYNILSHGVTKVDPVDVISDNGIEVITYYRNFFVWDIVKYIVTEMLGAAPVFQSTFFTEAINPVTLAENHYNYVTISQKSDHKRSNSLIQASGYATKGMITFNGLMNILRCMNLSWDYDGTTFRLEHISYWPVKEGINIKSKDTTFLSNKFKYQKDQIPKYEMFKWMESNNIEFVGYPIWYDSVCANQDSKYNMVEYNFDVTTDVQYMIDCMKTEGNDTLINDNGWVLMACQKRGNDYYLRFNGLSEILPNADMSWYWLHQCFWKHNRPLIRGYMNQLLTNFYSSQKNKVQECSILWNRFFDPTEAITTQLGSRFFDGQKAIVRLAKRRPYDQIDLELLYGDPGNEIVPVSYVKFIQVEEVKTDEMWPYKSIFYVLLSEEAPAGGVMASFTIVITDGIGGFLKSSPITISIPFGNYKGASVEIEWPDPGGGPPYCIQTVADITHTPGWSFRYKLNSSCL